MILPGGVLWQDHSSEKSLVVLSHGTTWFSNFYNMKFGTLVEFSPLLGGKKLI